MTEENLGRIRELRRRLHENPELSHEEEGTKQILASFIREHTGLFPAAIDGGMAFRIPGRGEGAPLAFRSELDALPIREETGFSYASRREGCSHACGHDGHMAALCGLILELFGRWGELPRDVYFLFQEAEEVGGGGERCARFVREKGIGQIYAFHNLPGYPLGSLVYRRGLTQPASEGLSLSFTGKPSHASAPEAGKNPACLLASLALYSQELPKKAEGMALCTIVGMKAGEGDFGISPGEGSLSFTLRAEREDEMNRMENALLAEAKRLGEREGIGVRHAVFDVFPETRNEDAALDRVLSSAAFLGIPAMEMKELWRASEDFGYYGKVCPAAMVYLGAGGDHAPLHTVTYDFPDELLPIAVDLFARTALTEP